MIYGFETIFGCVLFVCTFFFFPVILYHHVERTETLGIYDTISSLGDGSLGIYALKRLNI